MIRINSNVVFGFCTFVGASSVFNNVFLPFGSSVSSTSDSTPLLIPGQQINSPNGSYRLVFQTDHNLVLYSSNNTVMWTTDTNDKPANYLWFQSDGNLVLTSNFDHSGVVWAANIYSPSSDPYQSLAANARFVLQDDGNFVEMIDSKYVVSPTAGFYRILGDTGSGNNTVSPHFDRIN